MQQHADFGSKISILILKAAVEKVGRSAPFQHKNKC